MDKRTLGALSVLVLIGAPVILGCSPDEPKARRGPLRSNPPKAATGRVPDKAIAPEMTGLALSLDRQAALEAGTDAQPKPIAAYVTAPVIAIAPSPAVPGDLLFVVEVPDSDIAKARYMWFVQQTLTSQQVTLATEGILRDTSIRVIVETDHWQAQATTVLANRKPVVTGFSQPNATENGYSMVIRATDPDGDLLSLVLPTKANGLRVQGMSLFIEGEAALESKSIPLFVSDGRDQTGLLVPFKPFP